MFHGGSRASDAGDFRADLSHEIENHPDIIVLKTLVKGIPLQRPVPHHNPDALRPTDNLDDKYRPVGCSSRTKPITDIARAAGLIGGRRSHGHRSARHLIDMEPSQVILKNIVRKIRRNHSNSESISQNTHAPLIFPAKK
jgi:hypothetical protein